MIFIFFFLLSCLAAWLTALWAVAFHSSGASKLRLTSAAAGSFKRTRGLRPREADLSASGTAGEVKAPGADHAKVQDVHSGSFYVCRTLGRTGAN